MARYGITIYRTDVYGPEAGQDFSVDPIEITVLDFDRVRIVWRQSSGTYSMARLLRSQTSFPETVDDGEVIWSQESDDGSNIQLSTNIIYDGVEAVARGNFPLVQGKPVFYRMFLFDTQSKQWVPAGQSRSLIPKDHDLHRKMIEWLPRVYTSIDQNPIGVISEDTDIYKFMGGISFSAEELLTLIDLLQPTISQDRYTHVPRIRLERDSLGLIPEPTLPVKSQRTLVREARNLYARKGTALGLAAYVESLTGFAPTVTTEANLMLSNADATFYQTVGNWTGVNATLESIHDSNHDDSAFFANEPRVMDKNNYCKVTVTGSGASMNLGYTGTQVYEKVPVTPGKFYTFSCYFKGPGINSITPKIHLYDQGGSLIQTITGTIDGSSTWKKLSDEFYAPKDVVQAVLFGESDGSRYYYTTAIAPQVTVGATVNISGFATGSPFNQTNQVVTEVDGEGFAIEIVDDILFEDSTQAIVKTVYEGNDAHYVGLSLEFGASSGNYYVDLVCIQEGKEADATEYSEARAVDIVLAPKKINYIKNPSFETSVSSNTFTSWSFSPLLNGTVSQSTSVPSKLSAGSKSAKIVAASPTSSWSLESNRVDIVKGQYWTGSIYCKSDVPISLKLVRWDADDNYITHGEVSIPASNTWKRYSVTDVVDCECVSATISLMVEATGGTVYLDAAQLEQTFKMTEYYDGGFAFDTGAEWQGTAHNSFTIVYPEKPLKMVRLVDTIDEWIPKHLWWRISTISESNPLESKTFIE